MGSQHNQEQNVLDNFNRSGPALGSNWLGSGPTIASNQLNGDTDATIYWKESYGENQWASLKIVQMDGCDEVGISLKAIANTHTNGIVNVRYNACATPNLIIYTYNPNLNNWSPFNGSNVTISAGDVISVLVQSNRMVTVYVNGIQKVSDILHTENAGFDIARTGQIGLSTSSKHIIVDDFDGGNGDAPNPSSEPTSVPTASLSPRVYLPVVGSRQ